MGALAAEESLLQRGIALVRNTCRVNAHQVPEDGAVRRKICCVFQNVFE